MKKAVILLSGGMDSVTCLGIAKEQGYECYALTIDFGQRHRSEIQAAIRLAKALNVVEHKIFHCPLGEIGGSAQTEKSILVPNFSDVNKNAIPSTYTPARNTIFLSIALGWAEVLGAYDIFIGANAVDYSGYPDCRPEYFEAFAKLCTLATKKGVEGSGNFAIRTPLLHLSKAQITQKGLELNIPFEETVTCYSANDAGEACGVCPSCALRRKGFLDLKMRDMTRYQANVEPVCA